MRCTGTIAPHALQPAPHARAAPCASCAASSRPMRRTLCTMHCTSTHNLAVLRHHIIPPIGNTTRSQIAQFAHFSVKEFSTSERLASAEERLSFYHILPEPAHTLLAHAGLSILLQLDDKIDRDAIPQFPLAPYAAQHWVDHAQFANVPSHIQEVMKRLFDSGRPHFAAWVWLYGIDCYWTERMPTTHPTQPDAVPLYYASLCGFVGLTEHLIAAHSWDVNIKGGSHTTPLHATPIGPAYSPTYQPHKQPDEMATALARAHAPSPNQNRQSQSRPKSSRHKPYSRSPTAVTRDRPNDETARIDGSVSTNGKSKMPEGSAPASSRLQRRSFRAWTTHTPKQHSITISTYPDTHTHTHSAVQIPLCSNSNVSRDHNSCSNITFLSLCQGAPDGSSSPSEGEQEVHKQKHRHKHAHCSSDAATTTTPRRC
jgi:hypothetical protein